jgi:lipoprotein signal peptidase
MTASLLELHEGPAAPSPPVAPALGIATAAFIADALTKLWAVVALEVHGGGTMELVRGNLELGVARNPGAAFSFLRDAPEAVRRPLFVGVSIAAILFVMAAYRRLDRARVAARWGFALVLGGALGNLVDRIRDASVVDFIQAHATWGGVDHRWPVFNVADVAISVGVALLLADIVGRRASRERVSP